jgi:hypothetical protein
MVILFKISLFLLIFSTLFDGSYSQLVTVNTSRGTVIGYHFDQGSDTNKTFYGQSDIFLGIPFALPPVGELRYKVRTFKNEFFLFLATPSINTISWV